MFSRRLALVIGIVGISGLVQACSATAQDSLDEEQPAGDTPAADDQKDIPSESSTPAPSAPAAEPTTPAAPAKSKMTFFVTSTGSGDKGGNLGGLEGADKKCQDLATAVNGGDHTWRAYLSIKDKPAKDRIGTGPWFNQAGTQVAADVASLHLYAFNVLAANMLDEKGQAIPEKGKMILTGSKQDGTPATACAGWTSNAGNQVGRAGDALAEKSVVLGSHWNDGTKNYACTAAEIAKNKGQGRLYCFAID